MTANDPMELAERLRKTAGLLRVRSLPLSDFIPLLQRAADMLERLNDPTGVLQASGVTKPGTCGTCSLPEAERAKYANGCPMNYPELTCPRWASWRDSK